MPFAFSPSVARETARHLRDGVSLALDLVVHATHGLVVDPSGKEGKGCSCCGEFPQ